MVVPRPYGNSVGETRAELHSFSDRSLGAYGCCTHIKIHFNQD